MLIGDSKDFVQVFQTSKVWKLLTLLNEIRSE